MSGITQVLRDGYSARRNLQHRPSSGHRLVKARVESRLQAQPNDTRFEGMYMTHRDALWSYVVRRVARDEVDDAVAEVFIVAWRKVGQCPEPEEQLPWLYAIGRNVVRNTHRASNRRNRLWSKVASIRSLDEAGSDVQVIRSFDDMELLTAVSRLKPIDQELLRLHTWEELPIKDIAVVVGLSPKSVESRLVRIRKNLARMLAVPASTPHGVRPGFAHEGGEQ
jgi:RNA polymerase sigma-70 factor (ECF subfamily)